MILEFTFLGSHLYKIFPQKETKAENELVRLWKKTSYTSICIFTSSLSLIF